ncbi:MAG TPA: GNAT family N-acetyltransferase [Ilumatobacteraceae bacterium]|nr:GNAT family N-acetyltransferase [Ilumatobacteraceae bacterium]
MLPSPIKADRLVLRPLRVSDADEMATVLADHSLYEFTGGRPPTVSELVNRYQQQTAGPGTPGEAWCNWIIRVDTQERAVGFVQATVVGDLADLAWVLGALDHGRGFATEAVMAVCDWLAENKVRRIEAHIHPRHEASQAVAQRIGMVRTGDCDDEDEEIWAAELGVTSHRASAR